MGKAKGPQTEDPKSGSVCPQGTSRCKYVQLPDVTVMCYDVNRPLQVRGRKSTSYSRESSLERESPGRSRCEGAGATRAKAAGKMS